MKLNLATFLLAVPSLINGESNLRGADRELREKVSTSDAWTENTGKCTGQNCGLWGDPHIVSCDGYAYDCQGVGIFTLMSNTLWDIHATFVSVGKEELKLVEGWGLTEGASVTNDVAINMTLPGYTFPVFQAGFGELIHDDIPPSEHGCYEGFYSKKTNMKGQGRSVAKTMQLCRKRCEGIVGCDHFSWWRDGGCHMNSADQPLRRIPKGWTEGLTGTMEGGDYPDCGKEPEVKELADKTEEDHHGVIWNHCPLLFYIAGVLIDISEINGNGYLHGNETSDFSVKLENNRYLYVSYKVGPEDGDWAVVKLMAEGDGPGEIWSCHWSMWVCIPDMFRDTELPAKSVGLFGSIDGDVTNDWMTSNGTVIPLPNSKNDKTSIDYCYDNWCVSQLDSLMTFPGNTTYEDWKCEEHDYKDYTNNETAKNCKVGHKVIEKVCKDLPTYLQHGCEVDCCYGGPCGYDDPVSEVPEWIKVRTNVSVPEVDIPDHRYCEGEDFQNTANDVCQGTAESIIVLVHSDDDAPAIDVDTMFYGIEMNAEPHDEQTGKRVTFKINNQEAGANIFIKHYSSYVETIMDPACDSMLEAVAGCPLEGDEPSPDIEVACHEYEGMPSFATFTVYVESTKIVNDEKVDKCCLAEAGLDADRAGAGGSYKHTFKILCDCPDSNTA